MAQHNASLKKTLQAALKHKKAGTELAEAIEAVEALAASVATDMSEQSDKKVLARCRHMCAHRVFGKRLADAMATLDAIATAEAIEVTDGIDQTIAGEGSAHKGKLRSIIIKEMAHKKTGNEVCDMITELPMVLDEMLVIYGVGGAKEDADIEAAIQAVKDSLTA